MKYRVKQGMIGKMIELNPAQDALVRDWTVRKTIDFEHCLIDPHTVKTLIADAQTSLAGTLANNGYALFGGGSGGDRHARFVLAIPYSQIEILP